MHIKTAIRMVLTFLPLSLPLSLSLSLSLSLWLGTAAPLSAQQATAPITYSATAIHSVPGQPESTGIVIKSGENMRLEFDRNGQHVIQILLPQQGLMYILDPQSRTYLELKGQSVPDTVGTGAASPCSDQAKLVLCQRIGSDTISGIAVERWQLAQQPQTRPLTILWDPTRRQALRQDFPDGSATVMNFEAMEVVNGRATERWGIKTQAPGRETLTGGWWFDPELRVVVREDLPGGEIRRLENITLGGVDPSVFQVPADWTKRDPTAISPPQAAPQVPAPPSALPPASD